MKRFEDVKQLDDLKTFVDEIKTYVDARIHPKPVHKRADDVMKIVLLSSIVGGAGFLTGFLMSPERRARLVRVKNDVTEKVTGYVEEIKEEVPEHFPKKFIDETLPRIQKQNDEMLSLLKEQKERFKEYVSSKEAALRETLSAN